MPLRCYIKPNRSKPRRFDTKREVQRVICASLEHGVTEEQIEAALDECLADQDRKPRERCDCQRLRTILENQLKVLAGLALLMVLLIPLARFLGRVAPLILRLPAARRIPLLKDLESLQAASRQLPQAGRVIEGEYTVIRGELVKLSAASVEQSLKSAPIIRIVAPP